MRQIIVNNNLTLDGVMQSPAAPDEDTRGNFKHGGWAVPYNDAVKGKEIAAEMARQTESELLFGRRTYEHFFKVWPNRKDNPFTEVLNNTRKYVASTTLRSLPWQNSTLLEGNAADAVAALKAQPGPDLVILGSGELVRSLMKRSLIDRFVLLLYPIILGSGTRMFGESDVVDTLKLTKSVPTTTGVIIATYERA